MLLVTICKNSFVLAAGGKEILLSYLKPVGYCEKGDYYIQAGRVSAATRKHIVSWLNGKKPNTIAAGYLDSIFAGFGEH